MAVDEGLFIGQHFPCIANEYPESPTGRKRKPCTSSDALSVYEHEKRDGTKWYDATCFSCRTRFEMEEVHTSSIAEYLGIDWETGEIIEAVEFENKATKKEKITKEERKAFMKLTGGAKTPNSGRGYRGLSDWVLNFYGHRVEYDHKGHVKAVYYPETEDGKLTGFKSRHLPKKFGYNNIGKTGLSSDLSGSHLFKNGGRDILIVGGEEDKCAAQDMLRDIQERRGYNYIPVVSPTTGEPSAARQLKNNYEFLDTFENIILGFDSDEAGYAAMEECAKVLPKDKVKIAKWSMKDPNAMLNAGKEKIFLADFYGAKPLVDSGITSSGNHLLRKVINTLIKERVSLPPVMAGLQEATKGDGLITGRIYNIIGDTSIGKSTFANILTHHFIMKTSKTVGIVSLEATDGEYTTDLLSYHLGKNLWWIEQDKVVEYMDDHKVQEEATDMFINEYGEPRFHILDERTGTWAGLQKKIEQLKKQFGCEIIVIDVLTDMLRTMNNELQAEALNYLSNYVKDGTTVINVLHTKKPPSIRDGIPRKPEEYDALGSSIFVQKAAGNLVLYRNKGCKFDPIEQNTTYWDVAKMRQGSTGDKMMALYYDGETRQVYDRNKYFEDNPDKLPQGYDLSVSSFDKGYWEEEGWGGRFGNSIATTNSSKPRTASGNTKPSFSPNKPKVGVEDDFDIDAVI